MTDGDGLREGEELGLIEGVTDGDGVGEEEGLTEGVTDGEGEGEAATMLLILKYEFPSELSHQNPPY